MKDLRFWVILVVFLSLLSVGFILEVRGASLMTQTCLPGTAISVAKIIETEDFKGLEYIEECRHLEGDSATLCEVDVGTYVISHWAYDTGDLIFWEYLYIENEDGKYYSILNCGYDI